jgi:GTPase Era involved in 16S rRNA processing
VLPHDVPYNIEPVIETWSNDGGFLKLLASVTSNVPRTTNLLLNDNASNLSKVAKLAEQDLQNLFHCEVFVLITVNVTHKRTLAPRAEPLRNYTNELDSFLS